MNPVVYYFGCIGRAGHYLHSPKDKPLSMSRNEEKQLGQPWGDHIDAQVFLSSREHHRPGKVHHTTKGGWSLVYFADYSVDTRPGSHSTFIAPAVVDAATLIQWAREQWPEVFLRPRFPELHLPAPVSTPPSS